MVATASAAPPLLGDTVAARVAEQLRTEIAEGQLAAGVPLRQNEVAARLGVSSTPVREAFQILERLGLVQRADRRGVRVFRPSVQDLLESYAVRAVLEAEAVRLAAARLDGDELARLAGLLQEMDEPTLPREHFVQLNTDFHAGISAAAGNRRLTELIGTEQAATATYVQFLGVEPNSREEAGLEHRGILEALRAGDADRAAVAMGRHLTARSQALEGRLNARAPGS